MGKLLSYADLARHYGITVTAMYDRVYRGSAPTPVLGPGGHVRGWRPEEVEKYDRAHTMTRREYLYARKRK